MLPSRMEGVMAGVLCLILGMVTLNGMQKSREQRVNIKFMVALGKTPIQCWRALRDVYGDDCLSKTQVRVWHRRIRGGDIDVSDKP